MERGVGVKGVSSSNFPSWSWISILPEFWAIDLYLLDILSIQDWVLRSYAWI